MYPTPAELRARLPELMLSDRHRLGRRLSQATGHRDGAPSMAALAGIRADIEAAAARLAARRLAVPAAEPQRRPLMEARPR